VARSEEQEQDLDALEREVARLLPAFRARGAPRRTLKSRLLLGTAGGQDVLVKKLVRREALWRWYFARELQLYERFAVERPPWRVPRMLAADEGAGLLVLERLPGPALATYRRQADALDERSLDALVQLCDGIGAWTRGLELAPADPPPPAAVAAMRDRLLEDPSAPLTWVLDGIERAAALGFVARDAAVLMQAHLRDHPVLSFAHGDLLPRNLLRAGERIGVVDWECAGPHVAEWDRALLWANVPAARERLEAGIAASPRPRQLAFWSCAAFALAREVKFRERARRSDPDDRVTRLLVEELAAVQSRVRAT
jgi:hypothetical protein